MQLPIPQEHEKKAYAHESSFLVKSGHAINFISWTLVLIGFLLTYRDNPYYLTLFGASLSFVIAYLSLSNVIGFLYKSFPYAKHQETVERYWEDATAPSVDIFLPICGEPLEVLRNTWEGVAQVAAGYPGRIAVYVLDDRPTGETQGLASQFDFVYRTRPNRGEMKKAGNLKYGYLHSEGTFILILDADFRPHPDIVRELLPYTTDEQVAIVQSPQYFDHSGLTGLQRGAGTIQAYFYRTVQRARGAIGGSICVGSCALYRRKALDEVGGTYQIEHSEDVWTGFSLVSHNWKIQYIPIPLAKGLCPDDLHNHFKQQNRWCNGSLSLLRSTTFWSSATPWYTKASYISGFMYYLSSPLILFLPIQNFFLLFTPDTMHFSLWLLFVPSVAFTTLFMWWYVYGDMRYGTILARMSALWSYSYALFAALRKNKEGWTPTGSQQSLSPGFRRMALFSTTYFFLYIATVIYMILSGVIHLLDPRYLLTLFWIATNLVSQGIFMHALWSYILSKRTNEDTVSEAPALATVPSRL